MLVEPFKIILSEQALVVTFDRPCQVVSWAPLHGGFRTDVSHVLIRRVALAEERGASSRLVRQAVGCMGLKGTVVGMVTSADLRGRASATARHGDLLVSVLTLIPGGNRRFDPGVSDNARARRGSAVMSIFVNKRLTHELMLESLALGVEMRAMYWPAVDRSGECYETDGDQGGVAVSGYPGQRFDGDSHELKTLLAQTLARSLAEANHESRRPT
jgi:adenosylcobinamide amidohydrolase